MRFLIAIVVAICLVSCADEPAGDVVPEPDKAWLSQGTRLSGFYIRNGPRQGFLYKDAAGMAYNYLYTTVTLANDTTVPLRLSIDFAPDCVQSCAADSQKLQVFLLPRTLTPKRQKFDDYISEQLKKFLDTQTHLPSRLSKTIAPGDYCTMSFGTLTRKGDMPPFYIKLMTTRFLPSNDSLSLVLDLNFSGFTGDSTGCHLRIPCGRIAFN